MKHSQQTRPHFYGSITTLIFSGILLLSSHNVKALTFVLDFSSTGTAETIFNSDSNVTTDAFDPSAFGSSFNFNTITNAVLTGVRNDFKAFPTIGTDTSSTLADGKELDIDFEIGSVGTAPSNLDTSYYFVKVGERDTTDPVTAAAGFLGHACYDCVGRATSTRPPINPGTLVGSVLTDIIATIMHDPTDLTEIANLLIGTISHEIGHTLSLNHSTMVPNPGESNFSLLGTGATGMPNSERLVDRAFSYTDFATLIATVGTRDVTAVPLPASVYLFGFSMALLGFMQRRKRAA